MRLPLKLTQKLAVRKKEDALRSLGLLPSGLLDFSSNDYLGLAASMQISRIAEALINREQAMPGNGATGSRLLCGNHSLYPLAEDFIAQFHQAESSLIFNSGYDANLGFMSTVPQRGDIVLYDELVHASIRDGILLGNARAFKFRHNCPDDAGKMLMRRRQDQKDAEIYIVTESIFSMDGDKAPLKQLAKLSNNENCHLVVDEAHATGVVGSKGGGLVQELGLQEQVLARIHTFGKALGCSGGAILGSEDLKQYLVNFARSLIYTTALPPQAIAHLLAAYQYLSSASGIREMNKLRSNIQFFKTGILSHALESRFIESNSAIHCCIIPGNSTVNEVAERFLASGFEVKPILSPTVPKGQERLRFCLHSYNSETEIGRILELLATFIV